MEVILTSIKHLCKMVHNAELRPGTEECLQTKLTSGKTRYLFQACFLHWFQEAVVQFIHEFTILVKLANDLAKCLQP